MTHTAPKRTYGFLIVTGGNFAGHPCVIAKLMAREGDKYHPINPSSDGERDWSGAPKKLHGLDLNFEIHVYRGGSKPADHFQSVNVWYADASYIEEDKAARMAKTLAKVKAAIRKANATEPGDILMVIAKLFGATWHVTRRDANRGARFLSDEQWYFDDNVTAARDKLRAEVTKIMDDGKEVAA